MQQELNNKSYISTVEILRGLAALAVCMFHFTKGYVSETGWIRSVFQNGWIGVEVFFVISGFVITYSLLGSNYRFKDYGKFLMKRILRIEPTYFFSIILILILGYLSSLNPGFKGKPFEISISLLFQHFGYFVDLLGNDWFNPVYWTLAIEFHYYLIIGLLIAIWNLNKSWLTTVTILSLVLLSFLNLNVDSLVQYLDIFVIGIVTAFYKKEKFKMVYYISLTVMLFICIYINHGLLISSLTCLTALLISFFSDLRGGRVMLFLGKISYSLYLLHVPVGGRIINLAKRLDLSEIQKLGIVFLALFISILASAIVYYLIESPSHNFSKKIRLV